MNSNNSRNMYIHEMPYKEWKQLCLILDLNKAWEQLGGNYMKYDVFTLKRFGEAPLRNGSPTEELLTGWSTQNHTVLELFIFLSKMQHYQAMMVLKPLVDIKYHRLICEGEENFSQMFMNKENSNFQNNYIANENKKMEEINENFNINFRGKDIAANKDIQKNKLFPNDKIVKKEIVLGTEGPLKKKCEPCKFDEDSLSDGFSYSELEQATGSWDKKNILGKGGFGTVYKGILKITEVAIKRLEIQKEEMDECCKTHRKQLLRELKCLNSYRHDNILPLYGYSIGEPYDCLVYQYMINGSLEDRLLCREESKPLTWSQRYKIATGTARGLQYLHTLCDKPLVHGDIKSANILLDQYFIPKIGDFGLAREGPVSKYTHMKVSRVHGTRPYLPDEFLRAKKFSTKVDTYSFGVVLFELATGLRVYDDSRPHKYLKDYVESLEEERRMELKDFKAGNDDGSTFSVLMSLGFCCISLRPKDRPEMVEVLQKLDSIAKTFEVVTQQVRYVFHRNSPSPVVPLEFLLKYDPISQHPKLSNSPNAISPVIPESCADDATNPSHFKKKPLDENNSSTPVSLRVDHGPERNIYSSYSRKRTEDLPIEFNDNTPMIRIKSPSGDLSRDSSGLCNDLPLISELGIKEEDEFGNCSHT